MKVYDLLTIAISYAPARYSQRHMRLFITHIQLQTSRFDIWFEFDSPRQLNQANVILLCETGIARMLDDFLSYQRDSILIQTDSIL